MTINDQHELDQGFGRTKEISHLNFNCLIDGNETYYLYST